MKDGHNKQVLTLIFKGFGEEKHFSQVFRKGIMKEDVLDAIKLNGQQVMKITRTRLEDWRTQEGYERGDEAIYEILYKPSGEA